jgi:SAM-dependent methyltransferase
MATDSDLYANVERRDFRPSIGEVARDLALRLTALRRPYWRTLLWLARQRPYLKLIERVVHLEGDVAECGVFRGRTLLAMANYVDSVDKNKIIYGFDSFKGFPGDSVGYVDLGPGRTMTNVKNRFTDAGNARDRIERVACHLDLNVELYTGYFEQTLPKVVSAGRKFCFVYVDCDIYESYRTCLNLLYDAVVPGGIILFGEYTRPVWPGVTRAVDEFFADRLESPIRCDDPGRPQKPKYYVIKGDDAAKVTAAAA